MESYVKGAKRGGFIYTATLLLYLAVALIGRTVLNLAGASGTVLYAVSSLFPMAVFIGASIFSAGKNPKMPYMRKFSYKYVLPIFLLAFGMLMGLGFVNLSVAEGVKSLGGVVPSSEIPLDEFYQYVLFAVLLCALPAFSEEWFFRGVLTDCLSETNRLSAVFTVALCFSLYHGNISQLLYQFIYGLGLGFLAVKTKSVIPSMLAHFINNFAVLSIEYFKFSIDLFNPLIIISGCALLILFAVFMVFCERNAKSDDNNGVKSESIKKFYIPFGITGIVVAALLIILSVLPI